MWRRNAIKTAFKVAKFQEKRILIRNSYVEENDVQQSAQRVKSMPTSRTGSDLKKTDSLAVVLLLLRPAVLDSTTIVAHVHAVGFVERQQLERQQHVTIQWMSGRVNIAGNTQAD